MAKLAGLPIKTGFTLLDRVVLSPGKGDNVALLIVTPTCAAATKASWVSFCCIGDGMTLIRRFT